MCGTWRLLLRILATLCVAFASAGASAAEPGDSRWDLVIDTPADGGLIGGPGGLLFLAGRTPGLAAGALDLMLAVDVSASTDLPFFPEAHMRDPRPRGWWPLLGAGTRPQQDLRGSLLDAELRAADLVLARLHPATTRVGLVAFAGSGDPAAPDARTVVELTEDYARVRAGLRRLLTAGAGGTTTLVAGLNRAVVELLATPSAASTPRPEARRAILLLTDGAEPLTRAAQPNGDPLRTRVARAARGGIRVDAILIGEEAERDPARARELLRDAGGVLTAIAAPARLAAIVDERCFAGLAQVEVANRTTRQAASVVSLHLDGSFAALVPLARGANRIRVTARAAGGAQRTRMLEIRYAPEGPGRPVPDSLLLQHTRLLGEHLEALRAQPATRPAAPGTPSKALEVRTETGTPLHETHTPPAAPDPQ
jgi:hypothetical protein